jgi:hypothetical protein
MATIAINNPVAIRRLAVLVPIVQFLIYGFQTFTGMNTSSRVAASE